MENETIDYWDDDEVKPKAENDLQNTAMSDKLMKVFIEKTTQVLKRIANIKMPDENVQLRLITLNPLNPIVFIKYIANKEIITDGKIVIFSINRQAARVLIDLKQKGKLNNVTLIVSSLRTIANQDKNLAVTILRKHFKIYFLTTHAKIIILKTEKNYYSIEGSGNFSYNARLEQYVIDNSKQIYEFSNDWIKQIETMQGTIISKP